MSEPLTFWKLDPEWKWLESTNKLQQETYGYGHLYEDLQRLAADEGTGDTEFTAALTDYLDWNATAAVQEMAEVREEFSWKPWAKDDPFWHRNRMRDEIIDVMHFLGNMLTVIGVDDEEFAEEYQYKQHINRQRAASGTYSAKKGGLSEGSDNVS